MDASKLHCESLSFNIQLNLNKRCYNLFAEAWSQKEGKHAENRSFRLKASSAQEPSARWHTDPNWHDAHEWANKVCSLVLLCRLTQAELKNDWFSMLRKWHRRVFRQQEIVNSVSDLAGLTLTLWMSMSIGQMKAWPVYQQGGVLGCLEWKRCPRHRMTKTLVLQSG